MPALCVGTSDFSLFELVGAYGTFANRGVHIDPIFVTRIEDRHGNVLANFTAPAQDAISEQTAYTMLGMLKNVVNAGTAGRIRALGITADMGGKTGTTQNNSDAWFVGVTPKLVAGVWVGGEDRSIHLSSGGEGSRIALPIFADFIKRVYNEPKLGITQKDQFPIPVGAVSYDCDESDLHACLLYTSRLSDMRRLEALFAAYPDAVCLLYTSAHNRTSDRCTICCRCDDVRHAGSGT